MLLLANNAATSWRSSRVLANNGLLVLLFVLLLASLVGHVVGERVEPFVDVVDICLVV